MMKERNEERPLPPSSQRSSSGHRHHISHIASNSNIHNNNNTSYDPDDGEERVIKERTQRLYKVMLFLVVALVAVMSVDLDNFLGGGLYRASGGGGVLYDRAEASLMCHAALRHGEEEEEKEQERWRLRAMEFVRLPPTTSEKVRGREERNTKTLSGGGEWRYRGPYVFFTGHPRKELAIFGATVHVSGLHHYYDDEEGRHGGGGGERNNGNTTKPSSTPTSATTTTSSTPHHALLLDQLMVPHFFKVEDVPVGLDESAQASASSDNSGGGGGENKEPKVAAAAADGKNGITVTRNKTKNDLVLGKWENTTDKGDADEVEDDDGAEAASRKRNQDRRQRRPDVGHLCDESDKVADGSGGGAPHVSYMYFFNAIGRRRTHALAATVASFLETATYWRRRRRRRRSSRGGTNNNDDDDDEYVGMHHCGDPEDAREAQTRRGNQQHATRQHATGQLADPTTTATLHLMLPPRAYNRHLWRKLEEMVAEAESNFVLSSAGGGEKEVWEEEAASTNTTTTLPPPPSPPPPPSSGRRRRYCSPSTPRRGTHRPLVVLEDVEAYFPPSLFLTAGSSAVKTPQEGEERGKVAAAVVEEEEVPISHWESDTSRYLKLHQSASPVEGTNNNDNKRERQRHNPTTNTTFFLTPEHLGSVETILQRYADADGPVVALDPILRVAIINRWIELNNNKKKDKWYREGTPKQPQDRSSSSFVVVLSGGGDAGNSDKAVTQPSSSVSPLSQPLWSHSVCDDLLFTPPLMVPQHGSRRQFSGDEHKFCVSDFRRRQEEEEEEEEVDDDDGEGRREEKGKKGGRNREKKKKGDGQEEGRTRRRRRRVAAFRLVPPLFQQLEDAQRTSATAAAGFGDEKRKSGDTKTAEEEEEFVLSQVKFSARSSIITTRSDPVSRSAAAAAFGEELVSTLVNNVSVVETGLLHQHHHMPPPLQAPQSLAFQGLTFLAGTPKALYNFNRVWLLTMAAAVTAPPPPPSTTGTTTAKKQQQQQSAPAAATVVPPWLAETSLQLMVNVMLKKMRFPFPVLGVRETHEPVSPSAAATPGGGGGSTPGYSSSSSNSGGDVGSGDVEKENPRNWIDGCGIIEASRLIHFPSGLPPPPCLLLLSSSMVSFSLRHPYHHHYRPPPAASTGSFCAASFLLKLAALAVDDDNGKWLPFPRESMRGGPTCK